MPNSLTHPYALAFDTALGGCSVAVLNAITGVAVSETRGMARGQSEQLVPMVNDIVARSGIGFSDLGLIVTTIGPGAFTGLRIGISAARGFGLSLNIPVIGITTTEAIARMAGSESPLLVVIETKREDFYIQHNQSEPGVDSSDGLLNRFGDQALSLCGDGVARLKLELGGRWPALWTARDGFDLLDAGVIAALGHEQYLSGLSKPATPLYLRDADVSVSSRPVRSIAQE